MTDIASSLHKAGGGTLVIWAMADALFGAPTLTPKDLLERLSLNRCRSCDSRVACNEH